MDQQIFEWVTGFVGRFPAFDRFVDVMSGDHFLRSAVPVYLFGLCWFGTADAKARARMLIGLFAMCAATVLAVASQQVLHVHMRPVLDPAFDVTASSAPNLRQWLRADHANSFPSDTATLYGGLSAVVFAERRLVGFVCLVWTVVVVCLPRVYFSYHYPSDILAGLALGAGMVVVAERWGTPARMTERWLTGRRLAHPVVNALLVVFFVDLVNLFGGSRHLATALLSLTRY